MSSTDPSQSDDSRGTTLGQVKALAHVMARGLLAALPLVLTVVILYWLAAAVEQVFGWSLRLILGDWYVPGMGLALGLIVITLLGLAAEQRLLRSVGQWFDNRVEQIPVVKSIYGSLRDLTGYFSHGHGHFDQVVMVKPPGMEVELVGLVTRSDFSDLPEEIGGADRIAVYLPMSYQVGGYMVIVSRDRVQPVNMDLEDALRFAVTAGVKDPATEENVSAATEGDDGKNPSGKRGSGAAYQQIEPARQQPPAHH